MTFTGESASRDLTYTLVGGPALPHRALSAVLGGRADLLRSSPGEYAVTNWPGSEGAVSDVDQRKIWERRIREELKAFNSSTMFTSSGSPAGG